MCRPTGSSVICETRRTSSTLSMSRVKDSAPILKRSLESCLSVDQLNLLRKYLKRDPQIARSRQAKCWKLVEFFSSSSLAALINSLMNLILETLYKSCDLVSFRREAQWSLPRPLFASHRYLEWAVLHPNINQTFQDPRGHPYTTYLFGGKALRRHAPTGPDQSHEDGGKRGLSLITLPSWSGKHSTLVEECRPSPHTWKIVQTPQHTHRLKTTK